MSLVASLSVFSLNAAADVDITGFASINAGKVLSGDGVPHYGIEPTFLADYPMVSAYNEDWSFQPESLFGLQVKADLGDNLSATAQLVSRGANDWDVDFEWAYVSYQLDENWTLQAGKKRLPLFYYSDFYDVGYAYVWMRPPADTYTWQVFNYNGVNALYNGEIGDWSFSANVYAGREDNNDNKLLGDYFYLAEVNETWKDIVGGVVNLSNDWLEVRATHMQYTNERTIDGEQVEWNGKTTRDGKFTGLAVNMDFGTWFVLSELNQLKLSGDGEFNTAMVSTGYRFDNVTPYIGYSVFDTKGDDDGEAHSTTFAGVRWDFHSSAAFKVQFDKVDDDSVALAVAGDSTSVTFGVDLVF